MSPLDDDISDWDTPCEYDGSVRDSGYEEESIASNSDWSVACFSETRINKGGNNCEKAVPSFSSSSEDDHIGSTTDFPAFEEQDLHVRAARKSVFIRDDGETIYGRLFEDPDPWRRIGIILGLEKDDVVQSPPADGDNIQFDMTSTPDVPEPKKDQSKEINNPDSNNAIPESEREDCVSEIAQEVVNIGSVDKSPFGATPFQNVRHDESKTDREGSAGILAMPQLQVVNGKFLAPSISFEWEESEEE